MTMNLSSLAVILMAPQGGGQDPASSLTSTLIMFASIGLIFYFMILRPQRKRQKERDEQLSKMDKGDKVILSGGMHGKITALEDKTILVEVAENTKIRFEKTAVTAIIPK